MTFNQKFSLWKCLAALLLIANSTLGQVGERQAPSADIVLTIGGEVEKALKLSIPDLEKLPRRKVRATPHHGKESEYEGVAVGELLKMAGVKFGENLRGKALANYLLVEAADGYQAIFALPELDPAFTDRVVLLAYRQDNNALSGTAGPLQIIVPDEKRHGRWVRQVKSLTIKSEK